MLSFQRTLTPEAPTATRADSAAGSLDRVRASAKFFWLGPQKYFIKGFTYGPFAPNSDGEQLPEPARLALDFAQIRDLGANTIRLYHIPPQSLLDEALANDLRVFIDVPWEKHRCFFEDYSAQEDARQRIGKTARLLGRHPATFAISVANEIPKDIVRYHGPQRVARFIDELIDVVKQEAPDCLTTYTNYPSTEFLQPRDADFHCWNVYLEDPEKLSSYLLRLQHLAGNAPLILGEFGVDSIRKGEPEQARQLAAHVQRVFRHGLAGSFIFSYTDDWFTGGAQITDWAFGVTTRQRAPKPAAEAVSRLWKQVPHVDTEAQTEPTKLPRVSVVVCSYNGARTLEECLTSLSHLNYPDYEVILVDDGSTDDSAAIATKFPNVRYEHQPNQGLSAARNVGARLATGQIVAYTDSDCLADPDWLTYLVRTMQDQNLDAVGGPNVPPPGGNWASRCVAASPGGPSHVMADDVHAEHVPGCNMAFRRDRLLAIGGFDPRFRVAGDDVDICWRFLDKGWTIGYAPAALVWHHRRHTIRAYLKQQAGYGRSESLVRQKHPHRYNRLGAARWSGIIYGEGAVALPEPDPSIQHGQFGLGLFQLIYRRNDYSIWGYLTLLEWHLLAAFLLSLSWFWHPLLALPALMWTATLLAAARSTARVSLPRHSPWWVRPGIFGLHLAQPVVRAFSRYKTRFLGKRLPRVPADDRLSETHLRRVSSRRMDLYWNSAQARGRDELLPSLQEEAARLGFEVDTLQSEWSTCDAIITGDIWHNVVVHTATEELGWPKKFTRARCTLRTTSLTKALLTSTAIWSCAALLAGHWWLGLAALILAALLAMRMFQSRGHCLDASARLLWRAGHHAKLENVSINDLTASDAESGFVRTPAPTRSEVAIAKAAS